MVTFAKRLRPTRLKALAVLGVVVLCLIARFAGPFLGLYVLTLFVTATWLVRKEKVFKFAKRLYELFRPFGFKMLGVLGFIVLSQALNFTGPYIDGKLVDGLSKAQHDRSLPTLWLYALTIVSGLTWLVRMSLLQYLRDRYEIIHLDYALTQHLQKFTLQRLFGFSLSQHTSQNSNIKTSVIGRGENAANNLVQMFLYQLLPTVSEAVILVGVLLYWSPSLGVETFAGIFAYLVWGGKINAKFLPDMRAYEKLYDKDQKFRGEVIKNIDTVITFAQEDRALKECCESRIEADSFTADVWLRFVKLARYRK